MKSLVQVQPPQLMILNPTPEDRLSNQARVLADLASETDQRGTGFLFDSCMAAKRVASMAHGRAVLNETTMNDFDLLNIKEVAELFRVKVRTIRSWLDARKKGKSTFPLPFSEPGRKLFWRRGDVRNWNPRPEESIPETPTERNYRIAISEARCMDFPILAKIIQKRKKPK